MAHILLVEDDPFLRKGLTELFEREGYQVTAAASVSEANSQINHSAPDLVVLDVTLPDGNGVELCQRWRAEGVTLPILFLTARDEEYEIVQGLDAGGNDYVTKPFRMQELLSRLCVLLRGVNNGAATHRKGELHNVMITLNLPPITEKQSVLVGTIVPGETKQGKISFTPGKTVLGDVQGSVTVTYEDAFGNAESFVLPVSTTVEEPKAYTPAADAEQEETLMILGMEWRLAAALGGCVLLGCLLVLQSVLLRGKIRKMEEDKL